MDTQESKNHLKRKVFWYFIVVTEQLPTKKSEEDTQEKDGGDSVANTNNTKKDTVESISMCSETEEDAKLTNSQQKMQSKLVDGKVNKGDT